MTALICFPPTTSDKIFHTLANKYMNTTGHDGWFSEMLYDARYNYIHTLYNQKQDRHDVGQLLVAGLQSMRDHFRATKIPFAPMKTLLKHHHIKKTRDHVDHASNQVMDRIVNEILVPNGLVANSIQRESMHLNYKPFEAFLEDIVNVCATDAPKKLNELRRNLRRAGGSP